MKSPAWFLVLPLMWIGFAGCGGGDGGGTPSSAQAQTPTANTTTIDVMTGMVFQTFTASALDGVQSVSCPSAMTAIAAQCICQIPESGDIFSVRLSGNGAVCGCSQSITEILSGQLNPNNDRVDVYVTCAQTVTGKAVSSVTIRQSPGLGIESTQLSEQDLATKWAEEIRQEEERLQEMRRQQLLQ